MPTSSAVNTSFAMPRLALFYASGSRTAFRRARCLGLAALALSLYVLKAPKAYAQSSACPAALSQMIEHTVASGETIESLAATYRLDPGTISRFNPGVSNSNVSGLAPGSVLTIPPFNGTVISASAGDTWQTLAERYNRRADLLFEVNGCVAAVPSRVFIPGVMSAGAVAGTVSGRHSGRVTPSTVSRELSYPLVDESDIVMSYGWQPHSTRDELVFNSGIAFAIASPNTVVATASGTVAFAGAQSGYGNLVVINHADGLQTRYANLSDISVSVGQSVAAQDAIGQVGDAGEATFLYFEVRKNSAEGWVAQDPGKYVPALDLR